MVAWGFGPSKDTPPVGEAAWRQKCWLYREAVTILLDCDHGDEQTCGCRDSVMERLVQIRALDAAEGGK